MIEENIVKLFIKLSIYSLIAVFGLALIGIVFADKADASPNTNNTPSLIEDVGWFSSSQRASRRSAVKVEGLQGGHGSGTYIIIDGQHYVITARHVIDRDEIFYISSENERVVGQVVWKSTTQDIAVLRIPKLQTRTPSRLSNHDGMSVGEQVIYTGYPADYRLLTTRAYVSGSNERYNSILLQGFVWFGYSGSGVYDNDGNLVAIVVAIAVEGFNGSAQPLPSIVYTHEITDETRREIRESLD
tara:strand:- start:3065 stop:3796 length:732 start_codon:yes stop_codon:yes gene_type:complete